MNRISRAAAASALLLALGTNAAQAADPAATPDCSLKQYGTIDLTFAKDILVPVKVNDQAGFMVLNTGSAFTVVWTPVARAAGGRMKNLSASAGVLWGTSRVTSYAEFASVMVGDLKFGKRGFMTAPDNGNEQGMPLPMPIVGALGLDAFEGTDFELDLGHRKIRLFSQDHCPNHVVYWANEYASVPLNRSLIGTLSFPMELEGKKVEASLSTGSEQTSLHTDVSKRLYGFDEDSPGVKTETDADGKSKSRYIAMKMTAPGLSVTNPNITLLPAPPYSASCSLVTRSTSTAYERCLGYFPMKLGRNVLEKLRLYFATKEKVLYYTAADATK